MKIYTNTFDLRQPSEKKFWVAPYSDFKIGIKVIGNKPIQYTKDIWLFTGNTRIDKDSEDNDFTYFKIKSGDTGEVKYTIVVIDGNIKLGYFTLTQVVTDSTVYEQESGGEIPSDLDVDSLTASIVNIDDASISSLNTKEITFVENGHTKLQINSNKFVGNLIDFYDGCYTNGSIEMRSQFASSGCSAPSMYFNGWYDSSNTESIPFIQMYDTNKQNSIYFIVNGLQDTVSNTGFGYAIGRDYKFHPVISKDKDGNDIVVLAISQPT